jgi:hypothetical protein
MPKRQRNVMEEGERRREKKLLEISFYVGKKIQTPTV